MLYVCKDEDDEAVVAVDRKGFVCFTCAFGKHDCRHIKIIKPFLDSDPIPDSFIDIIKHSESLKTSYRRIYVKSAVSTKKVQWKTTELQRSVYDGTFEKAIQSLPTGLSCIPEFDGDCCRSCGSLFDEQICWMNTPKKLIARTGIKYVFGKYILHCIDSIGTISQIHFRGMFFHSKSAWGCAAIISIPFFTCILCRTSSITRSILALQFRSCQGYRTWSWEWSCLYFQ